MELKKSLLFAVALLIMLMTAESLNVVFFVSLAIIGWLALNNETAKNPSNNTTDEI